MRFSKEFPNFDIQTAGSLPIEMYGLAVRLLASILNESLEHLSLSRTCYRKTTRFGKAFHLCFLRPKSL